VTSEAVNVEMHTIAVGQGWQKIILKLDADILAKK
jgi:hypothetical protein